MPSRGSATRHLTTVEEEKSDLVTLLGPLLGLVVALEGREPTLSSNPQTALDGRFVAAFPSGSTWPGA